MIALLFGVVLAQTCEPERTLRCGDRVFDQEAPAGVDGISGYQCVDSSMNQALDHGERVYALDVGETPVTVALGTTLNTTVSGDWYYKIVVLEGSCAADACLATSVGSDQLTFVPDPGVDYFVVVEEIAAESRFDLEVSCLPDPAGPEESTQQTDSGGCSGSAGAWLVLPGLAVFRRLSWRRRRGPGRPAVKSRASS